MANVSIRDSVKFSDIHETRAMQTVFNTVLDNLTVGGTVAVKADLDALRVVVAALKVDVTNLIATAGTLATKLNADAGVTDTNYAQPTAITTGTIAAITTVAGGLATPTLVR